MNYYLKKRVQSGFTKSDMANELGIDYNRYVAIEKGSVKMPLNLIDKFNEVINKGKENEITKIENNIKADEFWQKVKQKNSQGKYILTEKMHEFNIATMQQLVDLLGYKSAGTIWNYLQDRSPAGEEFKKRLYNFFNNELNIQIPNENNIRKNVEKKRVRIVPVDKKLDKYYEKTDFKKIMKQFGLNNKSIAKTIGVHDSVISRMTSKTNKPGYKTLQKVKNYLDSITSDFAAEISSEIIPTKTVSVSSDKYISRQKLLDECEKEISENESKIKELQQQIDELVTKNELVIKVVDLIKSL